MSGQGKATDWDSRLRGALLVVLFAGLAALAAVSVWRHFYPL